MKTADDYKYSVRLSITDMRNLVVMAAFYCYDSDTPAAELKYRLESNLSYAEARARHRGYDIGGDDGQTKTSDID